MYFEDSERTYIKQTFWIQHDAIENKVVTPETPVNACKIQNGCMGVPNGRWDLERCLPIGFACSHQLLLNKLFDPNTSQ